MSTKSDFSAGLAAKMCGAFCEAGGTPAELNAVAENEKVLRGLIAVLRGQAEVTLVKHVVDCSGPLRKIDGLTPLPADEQITSRFTGELALTPEALALYLDPGQQGDGVVKGNKLRKLLEGQNVLPAQVLDYQLEHPELIPESWKGKYTYFWGTIYRSAGGDLCVRCLCRCDGRWDWRYDWLVDDWDSTCPAAVPAS